MTNHTLAFIGGGNMATSLIGGLIDDGFTPADIKVADPSAEQLDQLTRRFGITPCANNLETIEGAAVVIFAVKPQVLASVAKEIASAKSSSNPLYLSIAAGIREPDISRWLGGEVAVVRTMPNTPALVRSGATALFANALVNEQQRELAESILRAVGLTLWVDDEAALDSVTALSGSGPAYIFLVLEAMEAAGVELGLSQEQAHLLSLETAFGAAKMALASKEPPSRLRERVTSPGGTTEAALAVFENRNFQAIFREALTAAQQRAQELGDQLGSE